MNAWGATAAGGCFAGGVALGLAGGLWLANRTHAPLWTIGGFFLGVALGGYGAMRVLLQAGK